MATSAVTFEAESTSQKRLRAFWSFFREELKSSPERYTELFHLVAAVLLTLWINMMFGLSDIGISMYMPFFFMKKPLRTNAISLMLVLVTCSIGLLYTLFVLDVLSGSPPIRFVANTVLVFVSVFLMQVAQLSQPWLVLAVFGGVFVRLWDSSYPAQVVLTGSLDLLLSLIVGCSAPVLVQFLMSVKGPLEQLQDSLIAPLEAVTSTLSAHAERCSPKESQKLLQKFVLQGAAASKALLEDAGKRNDGVQFVHARLSGAIEAVLVLVDQALWFSLRCGDEISAEDRGALRTIGSQLRDLVGVLRQGRPPARFSYPSHEHLSAPVVGLTETVQTLASVLCGDRVLPEGQENKKKSGGFLKPGGFKNKEGLLSAFKTTLAATICYALYTGADWSQIDTCVTTCIITTQPSQGMEHQKQVLRLIGDSLGGLVAIGALVWVMPHLSSIAGVTALVGLVTLVGGYIALGSYKLSYGGFQFSFCFYLATMTGTSTPTSLNEARDRVVGVMLGVLVMWLVYDQIKPVRTNSKMREAVAAALGALEKLSPLRNASCSAEDKLKDLAGIRSAFAKATQLLQSNIELRTFEITMTQALYKQRLPVIQELVPLLLQLFLRDITAIEGDILGLETSKQRECSSEESMRDLVNLSKTLSNPSTPPPSEGTTADDVLLGQVRSVLQETLVV